MRRLYFSLFLVSLAALSYGQEITIIPQPSRLEKKEGTYSLNDKITVSCVFPDAERKNLLNYLKNELKTLYNIEVKEATKQSQADVIIFNKRMPTGGKPAYELTVDRSGVRIDANFSDMAFYGIQSLLQLMPVEKNKKKDIPYVYIFDEPRFRYRGMHLDCSRHFWPVSFIKRYIDYIAYHKMNYFHWHLTDDQGWRIEIKKYPNLTKIGGWRNGTIIARYPGKGNDELSYGGYYTQAQVKEIVKYAADRYITVVPEIEMPGHSSAAIASYAFLSCFPKEPTRIPGNMISKKSIQQQAAGRIKLVQETWGIFDDVFCAGKDSTFAFLQHVLDEVLTLFPSKYIHVGGDECPKTNWKRCPNCQRRMKEEKLKNEHELQSYFIQRIEKHLNSKGRTLIGWDEILEGGLAPNAVVMSWQGEKGGIEAAKQDHDVIMTPGGWCYFDHTQSQNEDSIVFGGYTPLEKVYGYEPIPSVLNEKQGKHILGAQGNVWAEYMKNTRKVEYMIFPRMSALSEVVWTPKEKRNWSDFERRLITQFKRYELWGANYSTAYFDLKTAAIPAPDHLGIEWKLETRLKDGKIKYSSDQLNATNLDYKAPVKIFKTGTLTAELWSDEQMKSRVSQKFYFNKATGKKITLKEQAAQNYPGDGPFTLVNGIINDKGLNRGREFLGFLGKDCEAIIDLGMEESIQKVRVHILNQTPSWIWRPQHVEISVSADGDDFRVIGMTDDVSTTSGKGFLEKQFEQPVHSRFIKILVKNWGEIPAGNPGAGSKAWLFVDEIEVE